MSAQQLDPEPRLPAPVSCAPPRAPAAGRTRASGAAPARRGAAPATPGPLTLEVQSGVRRWTPSLRQLTQWAGAALGARGRGREISVRIVGPRESHALNEHYRGRAKPTNVLSFPAAALPAQAAAGGAIPPGAIPLGDLVICAAVVAAEAREQGKPLTAHWAHLVVHGALHLIGYDHEEPREAARMERLEKRVLADLGFPNPYRPYKPRPGVPDLPSHPPQRPIHRNKRSN